MRLGRCGEHETHRRRAANDGSQGHEVLGRPAEADHRWLGRRWPERLHEKPLAQSGLLACPPGEPLRIASWTAIRSSSTTGMSRPETCTPRVTREVASAVHPFV